MGHNPSALGDDTVSSETTEELERRGIIKTQGTERVTPQDFHMHQVLGVGNFGKVILVEKVDTGAIYAMKVLRKSKIIESEQVEHTRTERDIMRHISHPFIVELHYAFQTAEKLYMVMTYVQGGELFFHLKQEYRFSERRAMLYAAELVLALEYLHSLNIVYRDLKPENILLRRNGHIAITDFGLSKVQVTADAPATTFCGTPEYLAPEILKGNSYGKAVDWWSLGTLLYEMLAGLPPFYSSSVSVMYRRILEAELKFPGHISPVAQDLLRGMLTRDPTMRLGGGADDAVPIKAHPFFAEVDWDALYNMEVEMPFRPRIQGTGDTSNFDSGFTSMPVSQSVEESTTTVGDDTFQGFTFTEEALEAAPEDM